nr:MAG TPA_asm: hypothetical protein [Caudoviricetes sp.]
MGRPCSRPFRCECKSHGVSPINKFVRCYYANIVFDQEFCY